MIKDCLWCGGPPDCTCDGPAKIDKELEARRARSKVESDTVENLTKYYVQHTKDLLLSQYTTEEIMEELARRLGVSK